MDVHVALLWYYYRTILWLWWTIICSVIKIHHTLFRLLYHIASCLRIRIRNKTLHVWSTNRTEVIANSPRKRNLYLIFTSLFYSPLRTLVTYHICPFFSNICFFASIYSVWALANHSLYLPTILFWTFLHSFCLLVYFQTLHSHSVLFDLLCSYIPI
jgi:hypothetical protein